MEPTQTDCQTNCCERTPTTGGCGVFQHSRISDGTWTARAVTDANDAVDRVSARANSGFAEGRPAYGRDSGGSGTAVEGGEGWYLQPASRLDDSVHLAMGRRNDPGGNRGLGLRSTPTSTDALWRRTHGRT
jgi:hypothetical protein